MMTLTLFLAILLYAITIGMLLQQWLRQTTPSCNHLQLTVSALAALLVHGIYLYHIIVTPAGMDIGFFSALSFAAWLMVGLLLIAGLSLPVGCLGLLVYPFSLLTLLLRALSPSHHLMTDVTPGLQLHILFSLLAYSLLSIAMAQAILLYVQDKYLHNKHPSGFLRSLPSLETMETLLFRIIAIGVLALTISLGSGFLYLEDMFAQHLVHKTILSMMAWALFVILLWGHYRFGWRGKMAIKWSLSGFVLLMLAYFGSKFVIELILQQ